MVKSELGIMAAAAAKKAAEDGSPGIVISNEFNVPFNGDTKISFSFTEICAPSFCNIISE